MKRRTVGSVDILVPKGYVTTGESVDELNRAINELIDAGRKQLLINLAETQHLNSTALGVLISAHNSYVRRGGSLVMCSVNERIENIWVITKLTLIFNVYPNEELALASFK